MTDELNGKSGKCHFCAKVLRGKFPNYLTFLDGGTKQVISVYCHATCYKRWVNDR